MDEIAPQRLHEALQMVSDAVIELDMAGRIVALNAAAERLFNCEQAQVRGQLLRQHCRFYRDDKRRQVEIVPQAEVQDELPFAVTQSVQVKFGAAAAQPAEVSLRLMRGAPQSGMVIVIHNLAERRAQQALRESQERHDRLANTVPSIVWSAAPDGTITWCSARWYEYTGLTAEQNRQGWPQVLHPDDRERCAQGWAAALGAGSEYTIEVRNRRHDGAYRWFLTRATPVRDAQGKVTGWFGSTTDIHDLKMAEQARRESQRRLRFALEAAAIGEWEVELATGTTRTSLEHDRCFGFNEPIVNWSVEKFFAALHPEDRDRVRQQVHANYQAEESCQFECRVLWPDGSEHWIEAHSMIYRGANGAPSHVAGIIRDITRRKESEAARREAYRHRDEFLANASHEIRSPMASLMGFAELLSARLNDQTDLEFVRIIRDSGDYLMTLINDLLDLAKMESGKLAIEREPVRLVPLLQDVHALMDSRARDKGLRLSLSLEGTLPDSIEADPTRLRQILINLVGNAIKFTERGAVEIVARYDSARARLELEIIDSGIGLSAEAQRRLFEPFTQFAGTAALRQGGSGLGLALTRRLVELMGGEISCQSSVNAGSRFSVALPVRASQAMAPTEAPQVQRPRLSGRVLAADDREEFRYLLRHHLEKAGAEVVLASDGAAAIEAFCRAQREGQPFNAVVLDMQMPVLDGYQAARQLRAQDTSVPIVALSASAFDRDVEKCYAAGCNIHLHKPLNPAHLIEALARLAEPQTAPAAALVAARNAAKLLKILLIDDNRITCKSLGMLLEMAGHQVRVAYDGAGALAIARDFRPDVVVSDIKLPDMDGFDLLRALREQGAMEHTKFIALSGYAESDLRAAEPKFDYFLHKPVKVEDLERLLSNN